MRFKIDWASLIVGSKFTVFSLFYFVFEGNFPSTSPVGLIIGGAYIWTGLFSEFYGISVFGSVSFELKSYSHIARQWSREKFGNFVHKASESC